MRAIFTNETLHNEWKQDSASIEIQELTSDIARKNVDQLGLYKSFHLPQNCDNEKILFFDFDQNKIVLDDLNEQEQLQMIMQAAKTGKIHALDYLLNYWNFDINTLDKSGWSILDHAMHNKRLRVVHYLIHEGAQ